MSNKKFGCDDMAKAVKDIMTMANLSGFINQEDSGNLRQFHVEAIEGTTENASVYLDFAEQSFKIDVSFVSKK